MSTKKKRQRRVHLIWVNPEFSDTQKEPCKSRISTRAPQSRRATKIISQGHDGRDAGIAPFHSSDLLDAALWDSGVLCDPRPLAFTFLQFRDDVAMDGFRHVAEHKPVFGLMQPENGGDIPLRSLHMVAGRPQKAVTPKDIIGQILIDNVEARWRAAFPSTTSDKERLEALAKRSGVGKETLRKMMKGEQSPRIDTVDKVARALGTTCDVLLQVRNAAERAA